MNSRFASVSESEILEIQDNTIPENTKKATKFGFKAFKGKGRLQRICNSVLKFSFVNNSDNRICNYDNHSLFQYNNFILYTDFHNKTNSPQVSKKWRNTNSTNVFENSPCQQESKTDDFTNEKQRSP